MAEPPKARRTFGPVVLLGLAGAGLAAVAGSKPWVTGGSESVEGDGGSALASAMSLSMDGLRGSPLAAALALTLLACWGVVLVTRGRFRRAVALLGLVTAVGMVVVTIEAFWSLPVKLADALLEVSATATVTTGFTGWYAAALIGATISVLTTFVAFRHVPTWPEMGSRYDAPAGSKTSGEPDALAAPTENIDIWKALDDGRDPTA